MTINADELSQRSTQYVKCRKHGFLFQGDCNRCWRKIWVQEQTLYVTPSSHVTEVKLPESAKNLNPDELRKLAGLKPLGFKSVKRRRNK